MRIQLLDSLFDEGRHLEPSSWDRLTAGLSAEERSHLLQRLAAERAATDDTLIPSDQQKSPSSRDKKSSSEGNSPRTAERDADASPVGNPADQKRCSNPTPGYAVAGTPEPDAAGSIVLPFDQVQSTCSVFSAEWEAGERPDLPSYIQQVAVDDQPTLLRNLLEYEVRKRRERGESPRAEEYLNRLPEHAAIIRQVFLETSLNTLSLTNSQRSPVSTIGQPESGWAPASRLGEFRLIRELGRGGMGAVYEACHVSRGLHVALKTLPVVNPETLHRFKREFRLVAEITHPNLVSLHTLENDGGQFFITMDLIAGVDFRSWVRPANKFDEERFRGALPQLIAGVMALHAQGIVHRDLKLHNVLVTAEGRVILLDFGLVAELAGATGSLARLAGTPPYMAPEQASGKGLGPPADWYAVGVMIYEALSGRLPFESGDVWTLLKQKQEMDAPPLPDGSACPADLADLCISLLARSPQDRPDPLAIAGLVQTPVTMNAVAVGSPDELIGRETQLVALAEAKATLEKDGQPVIVFVSGRSGEGKTTLAERFLTPLRAGNAVVLSGRCYDRESVPFKALDTLIDALTDYLSSLPSDKSAQLLPDDIGILAQLFPELNRCDVVATAPSGRTDTIDQQQIRARAFGALRLLLDRISQSTPVFAFIDDLQWGDEDSARALFEVLRPPDAPQVFFLGSYRSDEADDSPFLKEWQEMGRVEDIEFHEQEVRVGPLSLEQSTALVVNLLGIENDVVRRRAVQFHAQTGGNPFLMTELAGCFDPAADAFHATDIHGVLDQKLGALPPDARPLLEAVSVSGQSLAPDEAMSAAGLPGPSDDILIRMRNARLLRLVGSKVDTYHDRIRYAILDKLEQPARRSMHQRLARVIEENAGGLTDAEMNTLITSGELKETRLLSRAYDLAYHWDEAGDVRRAQAYGMSAAKQARKQFALDDAARQYALAARNATDSPQKVRLQISRGRGEALLQLGRYDESAAELTEAAALAEDLFDVSDIKGLQGELALKLGNVNESMGLLEDALRGLGVRVPRSNPGFIRGNLKEGTIHLLHRCAPFLLHRKAADRSAELANHLLARLEYDYYSNNLIRLIWGSLVGLNRAERLPPSPSLSFQYVCHANDMAVIGWHRRAELYYNAAIDLSNELNDQWGAALAVNHFALGCVGAARHEEAIEKASPGKEAFVRLGDAFEVHMASCFIAAGQYGPGQVAAAIAESQWLFESCVRQGNNLLGSVALSIWSRAARGRLPFDELSGLIDIEDGNILGISNAAMAEGNWYLHHGRTKEATEILQHGWAACRRNIYLTPFNSAILVEFVTSLRRHAKALEEQGDRHAEEFRRCWVQHARWASRISWFVAPTRAHALRELSQVYAWQGKYKKAWQLAGKSCGVAVSQNAKLEHARSLRLMGQFGKRLNHPDADSQIESAEQTMAEIENEILEFMPHNLCTRRG